MVEILARDLMTRHVITVPPATPALVVARLLSERGISAVPVVDKAGKLVGIVTEADLIRRLAGQRDAKPGWLASLFTDPSVGADRYARTHGDTAAELMTADLVSVTEDTPAADIAQLMETKHIRRVVVAENDQLRGIVSRADLLRALVETPRPEVTRTDEALRNEVVKAIRQQPWADTFGTLVEVKDGVVSFHGFTRSAEVQRGLRVLVENLPGVKGVEDHTELMPLEYYLGM